MAGRIGSLVILTFVGCLFTGCLMWDPGGQVRRAAEHRQELGWNSEGNFSAEVFGSQRNFLLMEEETETYDEEGRVTSRTKYKVESKPEHAETQVAFQESTAQAELLGPSAIAALESIVMEFLKRMPVPIPEEPVPDVP